MGILDRIIGKPDDQLRAPSDQPASDRELVTFVRNRVEESRSHAARVSQESIWMTNIAYLMGYDGVFFDPQSRTFRPSSNSAGRGTGIKRNRIFVNKILPTIQNRLARLCKNAPQFDIKPNGPDSNEKELARLKTQIADMIWDKQKLGKKRIPLFMWMQQCGHSYIKTTYDPELGNLILDPTTGEMIYEGDNRNDVVSAFEVFTDPAAKDFDDVTWLAHCKVRKLDYFRAHYPDRGGIVKEEGAWLLSAQYEQRINSLNSANGAQAPLSSQMKNSAIECAYYEKRSKFHPNGRLIIVANGVLLHDGPLPVGEIPFAKFDDVVIGGKYASEAIITHLRPLQDRKNRLISHKDAFISKLLAGKYIAAKGHGLSKEALNDQSGEVIEFTPVPNAPPPQAMIAPQMPQYVYQEEQSIDENFDDISGIGEVSQGKIPAAGIPAIGMQLLQEQDQTRIGVITTYHEDAWARVMMLNIAYAQKFWKTPRLLKLGGSSQEYVIKEFTGADITGENDIIVVPGSTLPSSKTLKRQEILNAWQQGLLGDPNDPNVRENVLERLEFGSVAEVWEDSALDSAMCKRVIDEIEQGITPELVEYDNLPKIWVELNRYRKGDKFRHMSPDNQALLMSTIENILTQLTMHSNPDMAAQAEGMSPDGPPPGEAPIESPAAPEGEPMPMTEPNPVTNQENM